MLRSKEDGGSAEEEEIEDEEQQSISIDSGDVHLLHVVTTTNDSGT